MLGGNARGIAKPYIDGCWADLLGSGARIPATEADLRNTALMAPKEALSSPGEMPPGMTEDLDLMGFSFEIRVLRLHVAPDQSSSLPSSTSNRSPSSRALRTAKSR